MKNYILLLFVTALFQVNAQYPSNPVSNVLILSCDDYYGAENAITVPQGKFWIVVSGGNSSNYDWVINPPSAN